MPDLLRGEPTPAGATTIRLGQVIRDEAGALQAAVGGIVQSVAWLDPTTVDDGDAILVAYTSGASGQSQAYVLGALTPRPRPAEGTVASIATPLVTVSTAEGPVTARIASSYTPTVGDIAQVIWRGGDPVAIARTATTATGRVAPSSPVAPPRPPATGTSTYVAIDSCTYEAGGRPNSYHNQDLTQGSWGGRTSTGSWFYGTGPRALSGRTITRVRMWLGPRRRIGAYNAAAVLHLYAHTATSRTGTEPARVIGPYNVTVRSGYGGGWIDLPASWGARIVAGGGIAIAGEPYLGIVGRGDSPQSGTLALTWRR